MRKIYYKVVEKTTRNSARETTPEKVLCYKKGKTVRPKLKGSKIFIFKTRTNATLFIKESIQKSSNGDIILRVHAKGVTLMRKIPVHPGDDVLFWGGDRTITTFLAPNGTYVAKEVTVLD